MTRTSKFTRRDILAMSAALGATAITTRVFAADEKLKVAGIHASPVENAWNSRLHEALKQANDEGVIEYVFSEGVSASDYPRAMREYAEQGIKLIVGELMQSSAKRDRLQAIIRRPRLSWGRPARHRVTISVCSARGILKQPISLACWQAA